MPISDENYPQFMVVLITKKNGDQECGVFNIT